MMAGSRGGRTWPAGGELQFIDGARRWAHSCSSLLGDHPPCANISICWPKSGRPASKTRPHRHRHAVGVRPPDALRPRRGLPARHHQEAAPEVDRPRAALVPAGDTNIRYLNEHGVASGTSGRTSTANLGPVYGRQWRSWPAPGGTIDQIANVVIGLIRANPDSRRLIVTAWNPADARPDGAAARATACSSSTSPTAGCPASSTSARPTCSSACRSTSPPTRC
jgi:hypothetical protein